GLDCVAELQRVAEVDRIGDDGHTVHRADVRGRHGAAGHGATHGDDDLALDKRVRVGEAERRQAADLIDLDHGDAGLAVVVDEPSVMGLGVIGYQHGHAVRAGDDVDAGDYVTVAGGQVARPVD